jgi:hypothetical protein
MRGVYTAEIAISGVADSGTMVLMEAPSTMVLEVMSAAFTNVDNDSTEQLEAGIFYVVNRGVPAGTTITPRQHEPGDQASSIGCIGALTTEPSGYDGESLGRRGFNNAGGYYFDPLPEERPIVPPSGMLGLRLLTTPATSFNGDAHITYREIG